MKFLDLYHYVQRLDSQVIAVRDLQNCIINRHPDIGQIKLWPVDLDPQISLGHILYERERDSPYEAPYTVANVRFDRKQNRCWRRLICCKELMHIFDDPTEKVSDRGRFLKLMQEFEVRPMAGDISPMFNSELRAEWMALLILCPKHLRDVVRPQWADKTLSNYDVALKFKIPEDVIESLMSDYYDTALSRFTAE
jgi:hypothetical protein